MFKRISQFFRNIFLLFTEDLTRGEFERLFSDDMRGMYEFYVRNMQSVEEEKNRFKKIIKFGWYLFVAFLEKLTPARRLLYAIALGLFVISTQGQFTLQSFLILNFLLALEMSDKLVTKDELEVARDIQINLLPKQFSDDSLFEIASFSEAAKNVGGDYYDFISLKDGSTLVVIADVSGKGISAALYMVKVQTALRLFAKETEDPHELLLRLNEHLLGQLRRNYFLTILLLKLMPDGHAALCRAGHTPALLYKAKTSDVEWLQPEGAAIGLVTPNNGASKSGNGDIFSESLRIQKIKIMGGDSLLLYTDGVAETANRRRDEFGTNRIETLMRTFGSESPLQLRDRIAADLKAFRSGAELRDDTTFLVIKRKVPQKSILSSAH